MTTKEVSAQRVHNVETTSIQFDVVSMLFQRCVAKSDARPSGDQEVAGSISAGSGDILSGRLIIKFFLVSGE